MKQRVGIARAYCNCPGSCSSTSPSAADAQTRLFMEKETERIWMAGKAHGRFRDQQHRRGAHLGDRIYTMKNKLGTLLQHLPG